MVQTLNDADIERLHRASLPGGCCFAAGARKVFTPFADLPVLENVGELGRIATRPRVGDTISRDRPSWAPRAWRGRACGATDGRRRRLRRVGPRRRRRERAADVRSA
jgi:hypothetical protein